MSEFVEIAYFGPPDANSAYRHWHELNEDALRRVPPDAIQVDTGRDLDGGTFVRVRVRDDYGLALDG
jgi:hypothetical protein